VYNEYQKINPGLCGSHSKIVQGHVAFLKRNPCD
jgi:hypothetical protein